MNYSHVQISKHMPHDTGHHHHHHSNALQQGSIISRHNYLNRSDHHSMMKVMKILFGDKYHFYLDVFSYGFY